MKKLFTLLMFLILTTTVMFAQKQHPSVEDMHDRKWNYIAEKISLNEDQISKVKPIFLENEKAGWKAMQENQKIFKDHHKSRKEKEKVDFEKVNDQYVVFELKKSHLLEKYYSKLKKILPADTIHAYFRAERSFRRDLLKNINGKRRMRRRNQQ